ncbi:MAG: metallophosphoesterase [Bdellovibrionaceae bacterium]|nr:metallophosphoesterase [Pseudobdellovibrionaceae bacterium]MDW8190357.1 metallophosphoesterase [Pseudobdellovibrionaceae bacterium]
MGKKIKLVLSDLHLGKGRQPPTDQTVNELEEFLYDQKLIEFLNYYSSGEYLNADVEVIFNGDFLNLLQVDYRGHFLTVFTESICLEILQSIIAGHREVFDALAKFLQHPNKSITYVIGNHDQAMLWPSCRQALNQAVGRPIQYKNIVYFFDGVHIEHGHMHEAANRFDPKRFFLKQNIVEPILNLPIGSIFFVELVLKIKQDYPYVDKIRPFINMAKWTLFNKPLLFLKAWWWALCFLYQGLFKKDPRRTITLKQVARIAAENVIQLDLSKAARQVLRDPQTYMVIFGHNHVYEYRRWKDKEYFNCGTWTEVVSLDVSSLGRNTRLTFVYLEWSPELSRYRGRLKEWKGFHRIEEDIAMT